MLERGLTLKYKVIFSLTPNMRHEGAIETIFWDIDKFFIQKIKSICKGEGSDRF